MYTLVSLEYNVFGEWIILKYLRETSFCSEMFSADKWLSQANGFSGTDFKRA